METDGRLTDETHGVDRSVESPNEVLGGRQDGRRLESLAVVR